MFYCFPDEVFGDDISIHNNSLGVPLDLSTSSNETDTTRDADGFIIPNLPARMAVTTPGVYRTRSMRGTPGSYSSGGSRTTFYR